jgi:hypothetical protein
MVGNPFKEKIVGLIVCSGNMGQTTLLARLYADGGNPMTGRPYPVADVAGISRAITYGALVVFHYCVRYTLGRLGPRLISSAVSTMLRASSIGNRRFLRAEHCGYGTRDLRQPRKWFCCSRFHSHDLCILH